jgi:hypothetical protein
MQPRHHLLILEDIIRTLIKHDFRREYKVLTEVVGAVDHCLKLMLSTLLHTSQNIQEGPKESVACLK